MNIPRFEASLLHQCRSGDRKACRELARGFWDRHYIWKYGLPEIQIPDPDAPLPGPWPYPPEPYARLRERAGMHEHFIAELIVALAAYPTPTPVVDGPSPQPSIFSLLRDPEIRLKAAKGLQEKFTRALDDLDNEIDALNEQLQ